MNNDPWAGIHMNDPNLVSAVSLAREMARRLRQPTVAQADVVAAAESLESMALLYERQSEILARAMEAVRQKSMARGGR
jgi:hypothetical protein